MGGLIDMAYEQRRWKIWLNFLMHGEMGAPSFVPWIAFYKRVIHVQIQKSKQAASQLIYL